MPAQPLPISTMGASQPAGRTSLRAVERPRRAVIASDPFLLPLKKFPAGFSDADRNRLTEQITAAVNNQVFPAYRQFAAFITTDYIPQTRTTLSVNSLGGGKRRYQATLRRFTTTNLTAAQIHEIGLKEVDRITAEMAALAKANGYTDLATFRGHIENDPKYQAISADAILRICGVKSREQPCVD